MAVIGRLLPDESIIDDFAHDEAGQGIVKLWCGLNGVDYLLK